MRPRLLTYRSTHAVVGAVLTLWLGACGAETAPQSATCVTGATAACACLGGGSGVQTCAAGAYGPCECSLSGDAGGLDTADGSAVDGGATDATTTGTDAGPAQTDANGAETDAAASDVTLSEVSLPDAAEGSDADGASDGSASNDAQAGSDSAADSGTSSDASASSKCASDKDCKDAGKICDPLTKACVDCLTDTDCAPQQHCLAKVCVGYTPCGNSLGCVGAKGPDGGEQAICDTGLGECVECVANNDCPSNNDCLQKRCVPFTPCSNSKDCLTTEVCDTAAGRCAQCLGDNDCGANQLCEAGQCRDFVACNSDKQCTPLGLLCDLGKGKCAQCLKNTDCPDIYHCTAAGPAGTGVCTLDVCAQGQGACSGNTKVTCNTAGDGFGAPVTCPAQTTCVAAGGKPECKAWVCAPGASCEGDKAVTCSEDGLAVLDNVDCAAEGGKCVAGVCKPLLCEPGQVYCDGQTKKYCSADGLSVLQSEVCASDAYCDAGACKAQVCVPGSPVCDGNTATQCNAVGSGFVGGGTDCGPQFCVDGACKADNDNDGYLADVDCDDDDKAVHPGLPETCGDNKDNDCDGNTDNGEDALNCNAYYYDQDQDGVGVGAPRCLCSPNGTYAALLTGDCNDSSSLVSPVKQETCATGFDDNCDGKTEAGPSGDQPGAFGCVVYYLDADKDGFGSKSDAEGTSACLCEPTVLYGATTPTDCDDVDLEVRPGAFEFCDDIDNDCDGKTDESCDFDGDGFCDTTALIKGNPAVCAAGVGDCNDKNPSVVPGMKEVCGDGLDNDCNGKTDVEEDSDGCVAYFYDGDGDAWGTGTAKCLCGASGAYGALKGGDCDDADFGRNPDLTEICGNFKDDNCNNKQDEDGALGCSDFYVDKDTDGWGAGTAKCACGPSLTHTASKAGDCADLDPTTNPGSSEKCGDAFDNDCDGKTDEADAVGCTKLYADADNDSFGDDNNFKCLCGLDANFPIYKVIKGGDCDEGNAATNPSGIETCDSADNDCDGTTDEDGATNCKLWYTDADGDTYGDQTKSKCQCAGTASHSAAMGNDCNDSSPQVFPTASEVCDGFDNDCDVATDEEGAGGCVTYGKDNDGDGYGTTADMKCLCQATASYSATKLGDCNDASKSARPGLPEFCGDNTDNDCDGQTDEVDTGGCITFYLDSDGDGFGTSQGSTCSCAPGGQLTALVAGDCDDSKVDVNPAQPDVCNGKDDDCDGSTDEGAVGTTKYFKDLDLDGFGVAGQFLELCGPAGQYTATKSGDCNDADPKVSPVQIETCNYKDDNCNGLTDSDAPDALKFYVDLDGDGYGGFLSKNLCEPDGIYVATVSGDCVDSDSFVYPGNTELCNGKDDDCDGSKDEGGASLCPSRANASVTCDPTLACQYKCATGWGNANGDLVDGCECAADARYVQNIGRTCVGAENLGELKDNGSQLIRTGNILPGEDGDWFTFYASDSEDTSSGCDTFNVVAQLTGNPDSQFAVDLYRGSSCASTGLLCAGEAVASWGTNFYGQTPYGPGALSNPGPTDVSKEQTVHPRPMPEKGGECKCTTNPGLPGQNICKDNSSVFKVRVYRKPGATTTCGQYALQISNGLKPAL